MSNYVLNIVGCVLKYQDFSSAVSWVQRVSNEVDSKQFAEIMTAVFEELLDKNRFDLADTLFAALPPECAFPEYAIQRDGHIRSTQEERELQKREKQARQKEQEQRERRHQEAEAKRRRKLDELERQQKEDERRAALRQQALAELHECLESRFLEAQQLFEAKWNQFLTKYEFQNALKAFVQNWFKQYLSSNPNEPVLVPDDEQALAIAAGRQDTLVVARAGSGKTATIVNRAFFLQKHCRLSPQHILLLAFNKEAAEEMKERLKELTKKPWPHVMTFHALAWAVSGQIDLLFNEGKNKQLDRFVQDEIIENQMKNPAIMSQLKKLMLVRWRSDWEHIEKGGRSQSRDEFLRYRRSLPRETLRGDYVKSYGEKVIANFLFEHDLGYKYEYPHPWDGQTYRPDFTHFFQEGGKGGIIIEYFGMKGDPDYDAQIIEKRAYWQSRPKWKLIEITPREVARNDFECWLQDQFQQLGITCRRLSEDEIWERAWRRAIDDFTKAISQFIQRARKFCVNVEELEKIISSHECVSDVEQMFLSLAVLFYADYLKRLQHAGKEDFDGLLAQAIRRISEGSTGYKRSSGYGDLAKMEFVFVDEYQDFSKLFFQMLSAIRVQNPATRLFCVGDDWQAINGFAGSDLDYFHQFEQHFKNASRLHLSTNYRSCLPIVEIGNSLMAPLGGSPARAFRKESGKVLLADMSTFLPTDYERTNIGENEPAVLRIVSDSLRNVSTIFDHDVSVEKANDVVLLSRTNTPPWSTQIEDKSASGLNRFSKVINKQMGGNWDGKIQIFTAHKFKGLQGGLVVVLDAMEGRYPLIHPDWVFNRIFGDTLQKRIDEERRLFYVALTRAKDVLVILTDGSQRSPFLEDIKIGATLQWNTLPKARPKAMGTVLMVGNAAGRDSSPTVKIKDHLKADGFNPSSSRTFGFSWYKPIKANDFNITDFLKNRSWSKLADGVEIRVCNEAEDVLEHYLVEQGVLTRLNG